MENKTELLSLTLPQLEAQLKGLGEPSFRAKQLYDWLHKKRIEDLSLATNLPAKLREKLLQNFTHSYPKIVKTQSDADGTTKYLIAYPCGNAVEAVLMHHRHGDSLCISTQFGCRMGCTFCASTGAGFVRGLSIAELLMQVYLIANRCESAPRYLVLMGVGEPLDNYENVIAFLRLLQSESGYNMAGRNISLSTCGIVPQIDRLKSEGLQLTLSISLHRTTDDDRLKVMPITKAYPLKQLLFAVYDYLDVTGRRVSIEYAVVAGENDRSDDVTRLKQMFFGRNFHINLIPINPIGDSPRADGSGDIAAKQMYKKLNDAGLSCTVRRKLGAGIDAACGQLRRRAL